MSAHTLGPWHVLAGDPAWVSVGLVKPINCGNAANARLIAAAPDLLAALRDVARWLDTLPADIRDGSIMPDKVRAAIVAGGGQ